MERTSGVKDSRTTFRALTLLLALLVVVSYIQLALLFWPGEVLARPMPYDTPDRDTWVTDGNVYAVASEGSTTYIGGDFSYVGPNTGSAAAIGMTTESPQSPYPRVNYDVFAVAPDGSGGWYLGGDFDKVLGYVQPYVAHILSDGTLDMLWDPTPNGRAYAIAVSGDGNTVYVGGEFTSIGGASREYIAAVDSDPLSPTYGDATAWDPDADDFVYALYVSGNTVYAGGDFTSFKTGTVPRDYIAAIPEAGDGTPDLSWDPDADAKVVALAADGGTVFAGGYFSDFKNHTVNRDYIAAIPEAGDGTPDATWDPDADQRVLALAVNGGTVYAGGTFTSFKGGAENRDYLAAIPESGDGTPSAWDPDPDQPVSALAASGTTIYAGGAFTSFNGGTTPRSMIAAIDEASDWPTAWNPTASDAVYALAVSGNTVYAGGAFVSAGGVERENLAAIGADGRATDWDPDPNDEINDIAVGGSKVYVGGRFTTFKNGTENRNYLAAIDAATGDPTNWDPDPNNTVLSLAVSNNTVYAGGHFVEFEGGAVDKRYLAAIDATTGNPTSWDPDPNGWVKAIKVSGNNVYVGGAFTEMKSTTSPVTRNRLAAIDAATGGPTSWDPDADSFVYTLDISGDTVYAGGDFSFLKSTTSPVARDYLAAIDAGTGNPTSWDPDPNNLIQSLVVSDDVVFVGGDFTTFKEGSVSRTRLAAIDLNGDPTPWNPKPNGSVLDTAITGGTLFTVGFFSHFWSDPQPGIAVFETPTPGINSVSPDNGIVDTEVTITGSDFGATRGSSYVSFDSVQADNYYSWGDSEVKCRVPSGASGTADVTVTTVAGTSNSKPFSVVPRIASISPTEGEWGTDVTIEGSGFGDTRGSSYVSFDGAHAQGYESWNDNRITVNTYPVPSGSGAIGDTDFDVTVTTEGGTSNAKTFTVKSTQNTWYLAEGTTAWGFDCYITIENPNQSAVEASVTYMTGEGAVNGGTFNLPALSQMTINPREVLGDRDFSTKVKCVDNKTIAVDRTMSWTGENAPSPDGHCSVGVTSPAETWYLPEGSSAWGFECWLLIQNPNEAEATAQVTYMIENEGPQVFEKKIPGNSRRTYNMADDIGAKDASIKVDADIAVIPERAMYRNSRREGQDSIGTTAPATDYYLAEGTTAWGFTTYVLVQNPQGSATDVTVTYMTNQGPRVQPAFQMRANSRKTIRVNDVLPNYDLSTKVTGSQPIIAERSMYWGEGTQLGEACHDSIGMASPHTTFYLPDGQTIDGRETWTLVQNPNESDVTVEISYLTPDGQNNVTFEETIPANSRSTFNMADKGITGRAAVLVTCKTSGKQIMVERAMYWNNRGAGTDTIGGYSD